LASDQRRCSSVASACAYFGGQDLEAVGLTGLALEAFDLGFELGGDVIETLEIGFGGAKPEFGLMAARMQAGNASGFFKQLPARLRLGLDQFADAALPDHRRRTGAGGGVGEQKLHILGAGFLAVDAVDRAGFALDTAGDLDLVGIVEGSGRGAVGIVEVETDFGGVARRAVAGPRKDHVVHARGAHVLVGVLAHHPAHGFDKIGLAAAIGPDHAGQAALDDRIRSVRRRT
jgi:hypothetical protein